MQGERAIDTSVVLARRTAEAEAEYQALVGDLRQKWPDIEPIMHQPRLSALDVQNGIWIWGERDRDASTGSYLTYRVLRQMHVPVLFLGAYRVVEGPFGSLVFVARHPLPAWARAWNAFVGLMLLGLVYVGIRSLG